MSIVECNFFSALSVLYLLGTLPEMQIYIQIHSLPVKNDENNETEKSNTI